MAPQNTSEPVIQEEENKNECNIQRSLEAGRILAHPSPGEEVVITGIAGRFPDSDDIHLYKYNLVNKVDLISSDNRRWEPTHPEIPQRTGKINRIEKFDAGFFETTFRRAETMDPMCRVLLEQSVEATLDAGINIKDLRGTNTGVFIGVCFSETERNWFFASLDSSSVTGCTRSMLAQRISYFLGLTGPSHTVDTACSSSLYAFEHAYRAIRSGKCDSAFVGGSSLCLNPITSLQFSRLGVLSADGACKSFDNDADGYARSEAISMLYLQKSKDAKRIYAQILHAKANVDGYKEQGITYPAGQMQKQLLEEVYLECGVNPGTVDFLEAHATGTKVGDPEEILAMDEVFCTDRQYPLYVGSIKSNLGHAEGASGMCSLVKVIIGMEDDCMLPNLHYKRAREGAEALEKGRMVVVTEKTPWRIGGSGLAAINSFGFGGANAHVVLKKFDKKKLDDGQPRDDIPRLVCVSGRLKESVTCLLDNFTNGTPDAEFAGLLHDIFSSSISTHLHRGYTVVHKVHGELKRSIGWYDENPKSLAVVFGAPHEQLLKFARELSAIPIFTATIQRIYNILLPKGVNIVEVINSKEDVSSNVILGSVAVQIAIVDIFKILELSIDSYIGFSLGELVAAYADNCLTLEQTINAAFAINQGLVELNANYISYCVEIAKNKSLPVIPKDVHVVNYNSEVQFIISGPTTKVENVVNMLIKHEVVIKSERCYGFHSKLVAQLHAKLVRNLQQIIPTPKKRSSKWITASVGREFLASDLSKFASAEYFVNNLLNPIFVKQAISVVPPKSVLIQIGSNLQNLPNLVTINLTEAENEEEYITAFLVGLGQLYELGCNFKLQNLYPEVKWPVSAGTSMISPLIKWNHDHNWFVSLYKCENTLRVGERSIGFNFKDADVAYMAGHVIDGRILFPATGYLTVIWESFSMMNGLLLSDMQVVFEDVKFHRATNIKADSSIYLITAIQKSTGKFEIADGNQTVVTGRIRLPEDFSQEIINLPLPVDEDDELPFSTKDIYKELKLRGYNYRGLFRGLKECDLAASRGKIEWKGNWIPFMDSMLQIKILQEDTRNLYVPTGIEHLAIDAKAHIRYAQSFGEGDVVLPVYTYKETGIIRSGAIEIRGLTASSIARRKPLGEPVLESHKFVPLETQLSTEKSVRVNSQIILENNYGIKIRAVELIDDFTQKDSTPLGPIVHEVYGDQPLIQPDIVVLSKEPLELSNVKVEDKKLTSENHTCSLVIVSNVLSRPDVVQQALAALKDNGFILSRENLNFVAPESNELNLEILSIHETDTEKLVLLRKVIPFIPPALVEFTESASQYKWLNNVQTSVKNDETVLIYAQGDSLNGILGFVNCLRREPGGLNVKCLFINDDSAPKFDIENEFYLKQLKKGLAVNIYQNGQWGTYRHLLLEKADCVEVEHVFNNVTVRGDLSSLRWIEGPLDCKTELLPEKSLVYIYKAAINFRDIMTASGRINSDVITRDRIEQYNVQGFEFAGRDQNGKRVFGMLTSGAMASMVLADSYLLIPLPDHIKMEDAVTIPVTYITAMHAFLAGELKDGQSVLIHAGTGGVGQAAINIATHRNCTIFTTVGTQEKKDFLLKNFPQIKESHIGNSRDTSFERMIFKETKGRGVDFVLNSLAEEKLQASVRCLAPGGSFVEIGKFDLASNNTIGLINFTNGRRFYGVMVDAFFNETPNLKFGLVKQVADGVFSGAVKPLIKTVFKDDEMEQAFRFMAGGKHIGKVVVSIRDEEPEIDLIPDRRLFSGIPRFYGNSKNSYIISGGLGGFGLELADWLVLRGVRKLVLVSRRGVKTGYQASRIKTWKSYGVTTIVSTDDVTTEEGCLATIDKAKSLGPVSGIFNLAVVLKDALLENQNEENFITSLGPKAISTQHFDKITREACPQLQYFVVFSSVSCGRGNVGQTNYGMSNSIMERVCEKRRADGLPGLAIQWGAIGEVGLVADMQELHTEIEIGGTLQQKVSSCLEVLDQLLKQQEPIVSSIVVAEKKYGAGGANNIVDAVKNIIGLRDLKTISHHSTLSELGMDSMMAVEIKQTLEREYEVFLTAQDIRSMTFAKLHEIALEKTENFINPNAKTEEKEKLPEGIYLLLRDMGDETQGGVPILRLNSLIKEKAVAPKIFLLPGIEGLASVVEPLAENLASHALCLQYSYNDDTGTNIDEMAVSLLKHIQENLPKSTPFTLVAYSYGCMIAIQLAALLESEGRIGRVILVDGAPAMFKELLLRQVPDAASDAVLQTVSLCGLMQLYIPQEVVLKHKLDIFNCKNFEERIITAMSHAPENTPYSEKYQRQACISSFLRLKAVLTYKPPARKLKSIVKLIKPSRPTLEGFDEDYKIQELCENPIEVITIEGTNHLNIVKSPQVGFAINTIIDTSNVFFKQSILKDKVEVESLKEISVKQM